MRGLWRVIAYLAEDANTFDSRLGNLCKPMPDANLRPKVDLENFPGKRFLLPQNQPTKDTLEAIDAFLLSEKGMQLLLYELAEVNRIVYEGKSKTPPFGNLKKYWQGLGKTAPANRDSAPFMEAVGALAGDKWWRDEFATTTQTLTKWFAITKTQEDDLRPLMKSDQPASIAAELYRAESWTGSSCLSLIAPQPNWTHLNL